MPEDAREAFGHGVRVKVECAGETPTVPTISDLYPGANWHERETWELFGIVFEGHPHLVKLVLPEPFEGHPLRKDAHVTEPLRKRRTLKIMIGRSRTSMTTATADP